MGSKMTLFGHFWTTFGTHIRWPKSGAIFGVIFDPFLAIFGHFWTILVDLAKNGHFKRENGRFWGFGSFFMTHDPKGDNLI